MEIREELLIVKKGMDHIVAFLCGILMSIVTGTIFSIECGIKGLNFVRHEIDDMLIDDEDEDY